MENLENEIWKDIVGYEGYYQVSNMGRVKRLAGSPKCVTDRILKPAEQSKGSYLFVQLQKDGAKKQERIHRLVMKTFCPCDDMDNLQVNHKDENPQNNCLDNLEWCTVKENINYGNRAKKYGESRGKKVKCVETGEIYCSTREAERQTGFNHTHISDACRGKLKTYKGYHWEYIE